MPADIASGIANTYGAMTGLTTALTNILGGLKAGHQNLSGATDALTAGLVALEIVFLGYWTALGEQTLAQALKKALSIGFWVWFATNFSSVAAWWEQFVSGAGLTAGGMHGTFSLLKDPSSIASLALKLTEPLVKYIMKLSLTDIPMILILCAVWWVILFIYLAMAVNVFAATAEFHIFAVLAALLMPFGVSPFTRFVAEKGINIVVASGVKLMTLGFILAIVKPILGQMKITSAADINQLLSIVLTTGALAFLAWHAPRMAASMVAGSPSLSAGSVMTSALAAYGAARMGWSAVSSLGGGFTRAGVSAIESAARIDPPKPGSSDGQGSNAPASSLPTASSVARSASTRAPGVPAAGASEPSKSTKPIITPPAKETT